MTDKMTQPLTDKECEILIKDVVTLVMMTYAVNDDNDDELIRTKNVKAKTYQTVANVIDDIEHGINDLSDLTVVALATSMLSSKIYKRKNEEVKKK